MNWKKYSLYKKKTLEINYFDSPKELGDFLWGEDSKDYVISVMSRFGYCSMNLEMIPTEIGRLIKFLEEFR